MSSTHKKERTAPWATIRMALEFPVIKFVIAFLATLFGAGVDLKEIACWTTSEVAPRLTTAANTFRAIMNGAEYIVKEVAQKAAEVAKIVAQNITTYMVECEFDKGLKPVVELVKEALGLTYINPDIFKIAWSWKGAQRLDMALFHFGRDISTADAEKGMDDAGYRPANIAELLFFALLNPTLFLSYPLVALGSVYGDCSPCLDCWDGSYRSLCLYDRGVGWAARCGFLGVRK